MNMEQKGLGGPFCIIFFLLSIQLLFL